MPTNDEPRFENFFKDFNNTLAQMGCGALVAPCNDDPEMMVVVDFDGMPLGRVTTDIGPQGFYDMMLIVEDSFAQGVEWARANPVAPLPPHTMQ